MPTTTMLSVNDLRQLQNAFEKMAQGIEELLLIRENHTLWPFFQGVLLRVPAVHALLAAPGAAPRRRRGRPHKPAEPTQLLPEVVTLRNLRLKRDMPYRVLAEEMHRVTGEKIRTETIRNAITGEHVPHPRTLELIQRYLRNLTRQQQPPPVEAVVAPDGATH